MSDWFNVTKIDESTFTITEEAHWGKVHCYLFLGKKRAALIDTGLGIGDIKKVITQLTSLPILVITTHHHIDHVGGHSEFEEIAIHQADGKMLEDGISTPLEELRNRLFGKDFKKIPPKNFDINLYQPFKGKATQILQDKEEIALGQRTLEVIHTPGHTPGHICIYEKATGYLVTGDILYCGTLYLKYPSTNPVQFAQSIKKLNQIKKVAKILPGHHNLDIPVSYLQEADELFEKIKKEDKLLQGVGLYKGKNLSVLL